ncbi:aminotransferase class I/II-fold pyridoxal phosphate-dependent enzyme [Halocynthiibacter styelae]|uniref:aspartate transaminase n=1 Tax=Halocynthiibacter styelae TaxID=2761955 RepID=A0A8J7LLI6_9RHOB|nr:aminotransferase class I/II-fold pyridoxal phosphate-dependent enzyme [Paenihalocynthiibacter styelae]MBI1494649.1 aminotransferase class I/II-fold pyridoxal phosphate-dependent enzyme [Paenihalocynthiibacter styelae]
MQARKVLVRGEARNGFKVIPDALRAALNDTTKAVILNALSNPAGVTYSRSEYVSQAAAIAALDGPQDMLRARNETYRARPDMLVQALSDIPGLQVVNPGGAFYLYLDCGDLLGKTHPKAGKLNTSFDIVKALLEHHGLAVVHGAAFSHDPAFRISYAASDKTLEKAAGILHDFTASLT